MYIIIFLMNFWQNQAQMSRDWRRHYFYLEKLPFNKKKQRKFPKKLEIPVLAFMPNKNFHFSRKKND